MGRGRDAPKVVARKRLEHGLQARQFGFRVLVTMSAAARVALSCGHHPPASAHRPRLQPAGQRDTGTKRWGPTGASSGRVLSGSSGYLPAEAWGWEGNKQGKVGGKLFQVEDAPTWE